MSFAGVWPANEAFFAAVRGRGGLIGLAVGDVAGKGIPAALFMVMTRTLIRHLAKETGGPTHILARSGNLLGNNVGLAWKRRAHKHHAVDDIWLSSLDGGGEDG